ncbi:MAG TPA: hypothetical protein VHP31_11290 [Caproicibacter sp.]|nr:hypothetical protein [Caproicibacter sp.]
MKYKKYNFLFFWGLLMAVGSIQEFIHPSSNISLLASPVFITVGLMIGVLLVVSYFVINRTFSFGRKLAVTALLLDMTCYLFEFIFEAVLVPGSLWLVIIGFVLITTLLVGYTVFLCNKIE